MMLTMDVSNNQWLDDKNGLYFMYIPALEHQKYGRNFW